MFDTYRGKEYVDEGNDVYEYNIHEYYGQRWLELVQVWVGGNV